jgi:glycosyltransferase involved in cell wall biosynthesis
LFFQNYLVGIFIILEIILSKSLHLVQFLFYVKRNSLKILLVGPLFPPVHGQSLAFTRFYESIDNHSKLLIDTNMEDRAKLGKVIGTLKTVFLLLPKLLFNKIDAVYFTCSRSFLGSIKDVLLINLASFKSIRLINHLHGSDFYDFLHHSPKWYQKILFYTYNKVDTSIVLLDSMKNQFKDFENMRIEVVSNFYDDELNKIVEQKDRKKINLLYLSNIMKSKGIFELIDAFDRLSLKYSNISLTIAGEFIADEYLSIDEVREKFYKKIDENSRINYSGKIFGKEKVILLHNSDIFVLPSYYKSEAFPISILESMICRNAIVTTNYKYLTSIVKEKNGAIVKCKSITSLNSGLKKIISNSELMKSMQAENYKEAKAKYSFKIHLGKVAKILSL